MIILILDIWNRVGQISQLVENSLMQWTEVVKGVLERQNPESYRDCVFEGNLSSMNFGYVMALIILFPNFHKLTCLKKNVFACFDFFHKSAEMSPILHLKKIKPEWILGLVAFVILVILMVPVDFTGDTGDGIHHFLIAKNSWNYPLEFLNLWGKPLFILFASPFSQFGIQGIHLFNIICFVFTGILVTGIARKIKMKFPWLSFPILLFMPVYFPEICSGMTEPFFAFVLALSIYFFSRDQYAVSALITSFLPFARQEGFLFIPLMILALLLLRKSKFIPLLFIGTIVYSVAGYFHYGDILWVFHNNPYDSGGSIYGHGQLLHFVKKAADLYGVTELIAMNLGLLYLIFAFTAGVTSKKSLSSLLKDNLLITEIFLVAGYALLFFAAHTYMWWKGIMGSAGLERVMACTAPLTVLLSLRGLNVAFKLISLANKKIVEGVFIAGFIALIFFTFIGRGLFPPEIGIEERVLIPAAKWVKENKLNDRKIYFSHPYSIILFNLNPKDKTNSEELMYAGGTANIQPGSLIFWDAHFGPNEQNTPLELLKNDPGFKHLRTFYPQDSFKVIGGHNFEVDVFEKLK